MTLAILFLLGLGVGIGGEQLWHRLRDGPGASAPAAPRAAAARPPVPTGPPGTAPAPAPGTAPPPPRPPRRRGRRIVVGILVTMLVLLVGLPVAGYLYANHQFQKIDEVPVGDELAGSAEGTNYLLVGTDSRAGVVGNRSDTMLVLRIVDGAGTMMSIPRDLLVSIPGQDGQRRINAAYNDGPAALVRTVQQSLGIPLDRYVEIDFDSFGSVVDAVGGVTIDFPNPVTDPKSGLNVQATGPVRLDGAQALAYVRSRTYTEVINGETVVDGTGDLGRVKRQQAFLRAVLGEAGESRNPFAMARVGRALTGGLKIDDHMTLLDALRFAWDMGKLDPRPIELPVAPTVTSGGASVLTLRQPDAEPVLQEFR